MVEIFTDKNNQVSFFLVAVPADGTGNFSWDGEKIPAELFFTATATDAEGTLQNFQMRLRL